ncbi:hypothetical protein RhiirA5_397316 [Rhizophagus irregularis]|uniref:Uncharacterized protein n=1 Tax=Rhizophagus irregularis TaxID=588596 RepID=A0A2N0PY39_9GLOM|nr:hypothetical protein RhiirA5_397316 [Rhizophagus irregularis]
MSGYNCEIKISSEIGPVTINNPGAIYKSRPLSGMIQSAMFTMSTRSLRSESITAGVDKRKFDDNQIENSFNEDYTTQEFELDIDINSEDRKSEQCIIDESYITQEIDFDI